MSKSFLYSDIVKYLDSLYATTGYLSDGQLKQSIKVAKQNIHNSRNNSEILDQNLILEPFILAINGDIASKQIAIELLSIIYQELSQEINLDDSITKRLLLSMLPIVNTNEHISLYFAQLIYIILNSKYHIILSHTAMLCRCIVYLLQIHSRLVNTKYSTNITKIINQTLVLYINRTSQSSQVENQFSLKVLKAIESLHINPKILIAFSPPFPTLTTETEVDLAIVMTALVAFNNNEELAISFELFDLLFKSKIPLLKKPYIQNILNSIIYTFIQSLISKLDKFPSHLISKLIIQIYDSTRQYSLLPICSYIKELILPEYKSENTTNISEIILHLSKRMQIFIDIHANFPQEDILGQIFLKLSSSVKEQLYPSKNGLKTISSILNTMKSKPKIKEFINLKKK